MTVRQEQQRAEQLAAQLRSASPHMPREERLRLELLMARLNDRHEGLAANAQALRVYERDEEL